MMKMIHLKKLKQHFTKASIQTLALAIFTLFSTSLLAQAPPSNVNGGTISTDDNTTICINGTDTEIDVELTGASGLHSQWVITDSDNNILAWPDSPPFDFADAGEGVCRIWHLSYNGIPPFSHIDNLDDLRGRFNLSNYIEVIRTSAEGGTLEGGPFEFTVGDGEADMIPDGAITLSGESGENSQWVVTDSDGNILGLPPSPYVVDFDGAGEGVCLVWHLSYADGLEGLAMGNNVGDLEGCYDFSNAIEVIRNEDNGGGDPVDGGTLTGGPFEFCVGNGEADMIPEGAITLTGASGSNMAWVVTDSDGNILGLPPSPYVVDFDGAGAGDCLVWHLSFEDGLMGAEVGNNAADLMGTFDLSNPILVERDQPEGGTITGGPFAFTVGDGIADMIPNGSITRTGNMGENTHWLLGTPEGVIVGFPTQIGAVNFDTYEPGTIWIYSVSFSDGISGYQPGNTAEDIVGCYDLSNPIEVVLTAADSGRMAIFPNPTNSVVNIDLSNIYSDNVDVRIYNTQNVEVYNSSLNMNNLTSRSTAINVSDLNSGIYILNVRTREGQTITKKLVIR